MLIMIYGFKTGFTRLVFIQTAQNMRRGVNLPAGICQMWLKNAEVKTPLLSLRPMVLFSHHGNTKPTNTRITKHPQIHFYRIFQVSGGKKSIKSFVPLI